MGVGQRGDRGWFVPAPSESWGVVWSAGKGPLGGGAAIMVRLMSEDYYLGQSTGMVGFRPSRHAWNKMTQVDWPCRNGLLSRGDFNDRMAGLCSVDLASPRNSFCPYEQYHPHDG